MTAKLIMIQGTMSNAGKSVIAAGLCRIFTQDGYDVAPFKSQNMALNSSITDDGGEMGRAQVVQAEACGKKPTVAMNPVLLKPVTDQGSQVIVNGQARGVMTAGDYFATRHTLVPEIMAAFTSLAETSDIVVIEGAGSPAEINLRDGDIVNMGLAGLVDTPVLLVGDIDRGGVFAQLVGTCALLPEEERTRIKGFILNKFRGDVSLLKDGLDKLKQLTGIPTLGVVPYLDLDIDDEDSLSERLRTGSAPEDRTQETFTPDTHPVPATHGLPESGMFGRAIPTGPHSDRRDPDVSPRDPEVSPRDPGMTPLEADASPHDPGISTHGTGVHRAGVGYSSNRPGSVRSTAIRDIAVIRLPKVSNFTDFTALGATPGINVRYVDNPQQLGTPDLLILPGTRNTIADLAWLRRTGLADKVLHYAATGRPVLGICGGYQMLGRIISDPDHVEGGGTVEGLGLLPVTTSFRPSKRQTHTHGIVRPIDGPLTGLAGAEIDGYEIHMGETLLDKGAMPFLDILGDTAPHIDNTIPTWTTHSGGNEQPTSILNPSSTDSDRRENNEPSKCAARDSDGCRGDGSQTKTVPAATDHRQENGQPTNILNPSSTGSDHQQENLRLSDTTRTTDGCVQGNVYGTYLHGFFDSISARQGLLRTFGLSTQATDYAQYRDNQYNQLADALRTALDIDEIYRIMGLRPTASPRPPTVTPPSHLVILPQAGSPRAGRPPGLIHLYTGDGKGKTTAAIGLAVRAAGRGRRVVFAQFLKGRDTGELHALAHIPGIDVLRLSRDYGFVRSMTPADLDQVRREHDTILTQVEREIGSGHYTMLVLDEIAATVGHHLIDLGRLTDLLDNKPDNTEIVMTGRDAPDILVQRADYVTQMNKIKHPFDRGVPARKGIEW